MKARMMVYLEPRKLKALKARARRQRISQAELVRRLVDKYLDEAPALPPVPADVYARIVALGSSGRSDISERHDYYLGQAIYDEHHRR
jgi:hypothetical protein